MQSGKIHDIKTASTPQGMFMAQWNLFPDGKVLDDILQQYRIVTTDGCGNRVEMELKVHRFRKVKTGPGTWQQIELPWPPPEAP
jgi:hypothetical protein